MATVEKRSISLPPELAAMVDQAVADGEFGNASEVIREALRQWKDRRALHGHTVEELRLMWESGLASGTGRGMDESFPAMIARRARERSGTGN